MMPAGHRGVGVATLDIRGHEVDVHYIAYSYPTNLAAAGAWERCSKAATPGKDMYSVFRIMDPDVGSVVIALAEEQRHVVSARRRLKRGGALFQPSDSQLEALYLRRVRVTLASGSSAGRVFQTGRYGGQGGALLDQRGRLHPRRRNQG